MTKDLDLTAPLRFAETDFTLRLLTEADIAHVAAIEQRSHKHPWSLRSLADSLTTHYCIGLEGQDGCVSYAILSFVAGEAELLLFVMDKQWQGRGLAKAFLQRVLTQARVRARMVFLEVRTTNSTAVGLYESLGFNQVGIRPNYYPGNGGRREDALLYAIELM